MEKTLSGLATIAILALFGGVGVLAWRIGDTWTETTTQSMVTAAATICAGGAVVFALLLSLIVGIPMATRYFAESGKARREWDYMPPPPRRMAQLDGYTSGPPMLTAQKNDMGTWQSGGPAAYDLWEEDEEQPMWDEPTAATPGSRHRGRSI